MTDDAPRPEQPTRKQARELRLAAELRANLQRRKTITRAKAASAADVPGSEAAVPESGQPVSESSAK